MRTLLLLAALSAPALSLAAQAQTAFPTDLPTDKYLFLEDANSPAALDWVRAHNAVTDKAFDSDPRFVANAADALKIAEAPDRLALPGLRGDAVYNFWRDAQHVHGIYRRTTLADYLTAAPTWHTVIDFDVLSTQDHEQWVNHGVNCLYPGDQYCLVALSAGGEDASTEREFDLKSGAFVPNGFTLPHSKQNVAWKDKDTLLVARDWGANSMTASGYPYIVKQWKRGTPLDSAKELYRGTPSDISVAAYTEHDAQGDTLTIVHRGVTFFESEEYVLTPTGLKRLVIPAKAGLSGLIDGRVLIDVREDWNPAGSKTAFKQGSLLQVSLKALLADPAHLKPTIVFEPTTQEFLGGSSTTKDRLIVTTLNHVRGRAYVYTPAAGMTWTKKALDVPDNATVGIVSTDDASNRFFLSVAGFLTPTSLFLGDASTATLALEKTQPAKFDAGQDVVEQLEATSKDGTKVPYFVVHRKDIVYDGTNPTVLNAYGGFEVSETPSYNPNIGKLWLEHGGVFVLANIRGGGEFGPAWHEAGLKTRRQVIYDDFAAVGQDLITRKITSPRHLGIIGGSNGGLLMGVEFEQHPTLWNAVVIQVPLLDMLRFEKIAAGASWVGEYGSVTVPAERAWLEKLSPYNNLDPHGHYPTPLIFTTTKDDRVGPQHARKFAAKMEEYHLPFYYEEIIEGGHGAGANLKEESKTAALLYTYFARQLM